MGNTEMKTRDDEHFMIPGYWVALLTIEEAA